VSDLDNNLKMNLFPNPTGDFIAVQAEGLLREKVVARLFDPSGKMIEELEIHPGSTIGYFDCRRLYDGVYTVSLESEGRVVTCKQVVAKD
jgi:hypothetical protein